jgi:hypothetical protein
VLGPDATEWSAGLPLPAGLVLVVPLEPKVCFDL